MRFRAPRADLSWHRVYETRWQALLAQMPRRLAWAALLVAYCGLMAVLYAPKVPRLDVVTPLSGHLVGLAASAILALIVRNRPITILLAGTAFTILAHAAPAYLPDRTPLAVVAPGEARAAGRGELKVLALNVWRHNQDAARLLSVLAGSEADVLLLSEVSPQLAGALDALRPIYPHVVSCPAPTRCAQLLMSHIPLRKTGSLIAAADHPAVVWAVLGGSHPAAGTTVVATHLYRPTRGWATHVSQREGLAGVLNGLSGPLVLGGDLNVSGGSLSMRELRRQTGLAAPGRALPTWPASPLVLPQVALDHILVRGGPIVIERGVGPYAGSDHLPVWAVIALGRPGV